MQGLLPDQARCLEDGHLADAVQQTAGMQPRDLAALAAHAATCALTEVVVSEEADHCQAMLSREVACEQPSRPA